MIDDDDYDDDESLAGIFDADTHFKECKHMNMSMQKLVPASREAKRILDMLEHGARDRSGGESVQTEGD